MAYWIMLIWIMAVTFMFQPQLSKKIPAPDGVTDLKASPIFSVLVFCVPLFFICLRTEFGDTGSYIYDFNRTPESMDMFSEFIHRNDRSYFFHALQMLFKIHISQNARVWIAAIAIFQAVLVLRTLRKYSCDMGMSVFLFMATCLVGNWMCNGIRQFICVAVIFACTQWLIDKKWYFYLPVVLLMMGFLPITSKLGLPEPPWYLCGIHQGTLIMLLGCFFIQGKPFNKRVWVLAAVFAVLILTGGLDSILDTSVEDTAYAKDMEYVNADTGTRWTRVIVESVPLILALIARKQLKSEDVPEIIGLSVNASVVTAVLYVASAFTSGIFVGRLPIYTEMYNLILLPWLIKHPYKKYRQYITLALIAGYLLYFYYQVNVAWASSPYISEILKINVD